MKTENKFICPHCNYEYEDIQDYGFENPDEEGVFAMDCIECESEFEVRFNTVIYFETRKFYKQD